MKVKGIVIFPISSSNVFAKPLAKKSEKFYKLSKELFAIVSSNKEASVEHSSSIRLEELDERYQFLSDNTAFSKLFSPAFWRWKILGSRSFWPLTNFLNFFEENEVNWTSR